MIWYWKKQILEVGQVNILRNGEPCNGPQTCTQTLGGKFTVSDSRNIFNIASTWPWIGSGVRKPSWLQSSDSSSTWSLPPNSFMTDLNHNMVWIGDHNILNDVESWLDKLLSWIDSLWPSDAIWLHRSSSTLAQIMAWLIVCENFEGLAAAGPRTCKTI